MQANTLNMWNQVFLHFWHYKQSRIIQIYMYIIEIILI